MLHLRNQLSFKSATDYAGKLSVLTECTPAILTEIQSIDAFLQTLDPSSQSLEYLYLLHLKLENSDVSQGPFILQCQSLLLNCNPVQIRTIPQTFVTVCHHFTEICRSAGQPMFAIRPLMNAIRAARFSHEHITSMHSDLLLSCLLSRCFDVAIPFLEEDPLKVEPKLCTAKGVLLYFYYGGMVYCALRKYKRALDLFTLCFMMPYKAVSQIMVETYKKCILVSLLINGQSFSVSKQSSVWLQRFLKSAAHAYHDLMQAYETRKIDEMEDCVARYNDIFAADENGGLVQQVVHSLYRKNIERLTTTYETMSLEDIAKQVSLQDAKAAEKKILEMIEEGEVDAVISQRDGMVYFRDSQRAQHERETTRQLQKHLDIAVGLGSKLRDLDFAISSDPNFLSKVSLHERNARWGESGSDLTQSDGGANSTTNKPPGFFAGSSKA